MPTSSDPVSPEPVIRFYRVGDAHGYMSNFSAHPLQLEGREWPTSEHYFQAQKFAGTEHEETVRRQGQPGDAARLGRRRDLPLRPDWEAVKDDVMRRALRAKFTQHADLREALLATGAAHLIEATSDDYYWGVGTLGHGRNRLGELLMELRAELRREA